VANQFQVVDWLCAEALRGLVNKLAVASHFNTDYNKEYTKDFAPGETVRVPLPQQFNVTNGLGYQPQGINRLFTTVTVDQIFGIHFEYDSIEQALKLERGREAFKTNYLDKAMDQLAQEIDSRCALWALQNTNNIVGALGTTPTSFDVYGQARARLIENACPPGDKGMIVTPQMMRTIVTNNLTTFNPQDAVAKAFREGYYGDAQGFEWEESMSLYSQTASNWQTPASVTVNTPPTTGGTSMVVNCTSGDTFLQNDVFSIGSGTTGLVNNANPKTRRSTGTLKQFVLTQSVTATGSTATIYFQCGTQGIQGPGSQYQNVDALPVANALLTLYPGTTSPNGKSGMNGLAIHRDAFALVGVKLEIPKACEMSSQARDPKTGISVAFFRMMDPLTRKMVNRFDVLIGLGNLYPDNCAVRVLSLQ
jgi:hypothetical protein